MEIVKVMNNSFVFVRDDNDNVFISLIDHISFSIERFNKNISLQNRLLWEVKKFYRDEFKVGLYAVDKINSVLGVKLPEEEAGNIAFYIVNAQTENAEMGNTILIDPAGILHNI